VRTLAILTAAVCFAAAPARADRWVTADVERAITVADAHWPDSPCYGRHAITWMTGAELGARFGSGLVGYASGPGECAVWIAWDRPVGVTQAFWQLRYLCSALEHEFGHNAGLDHSHRPGDIMDGDRFELASDCLAAFRPTRARRWAPVWRAPRAAGWGPSAHTRTSRAP
jgi:hypothetical protein